MDVLGLEVESHTLDALERSADCSFIADELHLFAMYGSPMKVFQLLVLLVFQLLVLL